MNKELREDLEHLIICNDKTITPDLRDDVKMTLQYIDNLQKENEILKENAIHNDKVVDKVNWENRLLKDKIDKAINYIEQHNEVNINGEIYTGLVKKEALDLLDILKGEEDES